MNNEHTYTDEQIIIGCIKGDRKYQELLYKKFSPKMYAVCFRYAAEPNEAQDMLQEGFIRIYKNIDRFRHEGSFEGWVRRIFVNTALEIIRKKGNMYVVHDAENIKRESGDENSLQLLMKEDLMGMVQSLSAGYRTVFNLYAIEGFSHKEIGKMLNITEGTSKSQLARARQLLQKKVAQLTGFNKTVAVSHE
jgi:RNA polymerase sigma factor (sigma-70 family)